MSRLPRRNLIMITFIVVTGIYVVLVFFPAALNTRIIGFSADYLGDNLVVTDIFSDSPADEGGLQAGDVITDQAGRPESDWYHLYSADLSTYIDARIGLTEQPAEYIIFRGSEQMTLSLGSRGMKLGELLANFGVRLFLILCVLGLAIFVVVSGSREPGAYLSCMCFCLAVLWFASDQPYWPQFSSPLVRNIPVTQTYFVDLVELISIQLVMGTLLHIALIFPGNRKILEKFGWFPALGYVCALVVPLSVLLFGSGDLADRIAATYKPRLYVNSILIVITTIFMLESYLNSKSPSIKERSRWIVASMGVVAVSHLVLWNIPTLLTGKPIVTNYNWLLLTVLLLPATLAMAFTNHQLFGVRGVIRRRIRLLESTLSRQEHRLVRRDDNIRNMQEEIRNLRRELGEYEELENGVHRKPGDALQRLEQRYPQLSEVRQQGLIGVSPLWTSVFEQAVIASRGTGPVLIVGESGTGKTDVARLVHTMSERRDAEYKQISCAQFEHADPAFALGRLFGIGAGHGLHNVPRDGRKGLLEECDGGTLLLDDFDRLPLNVQDLFLYPLEGKPFEPGIGSGPSRSASVKFIFATNVEPRRLVEQGKFRNDVLARLETRIDIPPLRMRKEDIPVLVEHFVGELAQDIGHEISVISPKAMALLCRCPYETGNVRQLRAELQQAINKASLENDRTLRAGYLSQNTMTATAPPETTTSGPEGDDGARNKPRNSGELEVLRRHAFQIAPAEEELGYSHKSKTLSNHLRGMCIQAVVDADWDLDQAALVLAGDDAAVLPRLRAKMDRYMSRIEENAGSGEEKKLFNNLPAAYHDALQRALARQSRVTRP